jgi:hypothetical protein
MLPELGGRQRLKRRCRPGGRSEDERLAVIVGRGCKLFGESLPGWPAASSGPAIIDNDKTRLRHRR